MDASKWESLLGQLDASSGGGNVYYLKAAKTRLRLLLPDGEDEENFFAETEKHYKGKISTAFIVFGVILDTGDKTDKNVDPKKVRAIRIPKTVLRGIVSNLAEGWELFDPKAGHGLVIEKTGGGNADRTSYQVKTSPKPVPVAEDLEWPTEDLETIAAAESKRAQQRDEKKAGGRNVPVEVEEEEEDLPF